MTSNVIQETTSLVNIPFSVPFSVPMCNIMPDIFDNAEHSYSKVETDFHPQNFGGGTGGVVEFYPKYVFECAVCSVIFLKQEELEDHFSVTHENLEYPCKVFLFKDDQGKSVEYPCNAIFNLQQDLNRHVEFLHEKIEECDQCQRQFEKKNGVPGLLHHKKIMGHNNGMLKCDLCSKKKLFTPKGLALHKTWVHSGLKYDSVTRSLR